MNKRIDIIYNTNKQEWELERIAEKHGFTLTDNCYWVQIMRNQDGDSIVLTREDSELAHDPVGRLTAILGTTETTETAQQEEKTVCFHCGGECHADSYPEIVFSGEGIHICEECSIDFEMVCGVPVPRFIWVLTYEKIGIVIEALKKAVAPLEKEMEENNVSRDRLAQLDKEVTKTWGEIGVLQYLQIVQGTGVNPSGRKFRDVEMGEIVTIDDVLYTWAAYKEIHEEHPHFPQYLGNCQTYQGGTLEEIR